MHAGVLTEIAVPESSGLGLGPPQASTQDVERSVELQRGWLGQRTDIEEEARVPRFGVGDSVVSICAVMAPTSWLHRT